MQQQQAGSSPQLSRTLRPLMLWGMGVGYVIPGIYFGWSLDFEKGGTYGLAIAAFFIIILYITFTFSYTELACANPKAGGVFACFGALTLYVLSMITIVVLWRKELQMLRPFRVPLYPVFPIVALVIALISLVAMIMLNGKLALIYFSILALAYIWFHFVVKKSLNVNPVNN